MAWTPNGVVSLCKSDLVGSTPILASSCGYSTKVVCLASNQEMRLQNSLPAPYAQVVQLADTIASKPINCEFESRSEHFFKYP